VTKFSSYIYMYMYIRLSFRNFHLHFYLRFHLLLLLINLYDNIKVIFSILNQNVDHGDFLYICMKLKEWRVLNKHAVMFDTYLMYLI